MKAIRTCIKALKSEYINRKNILLGMCALIVMALTVFCYSLAGYLNALEFLNTHSTGWVQGFTEPDGAKWYTVENTRFGIDSSGDNARATTDGINAALRWAKEQDISFIRFEKGTYLIQCVWQNRFKAPTDGILVPSGLTLDLGDSEFMIEPNSYPEYSIFGIVGQSDVTILGGTLVGDKDRHVYGPSRHSPTHEFGFGICVSASSNVLIQGVTIRGMTGDGIILEGSYKPMAEGGIVSSRVRILGCNISDCRRQGISVIGAVDSEIAHNRISFIKGTNPQFGIDVETEMDYLVDNLEIHHNVIAGCAGGAISCHSGSNYQAYNNACRGSILAVKSSNVKIQDNLIEAGLLAVYPEASNTDLLGNTLGPDARLKTEW